MAGTPAQQGKFCGSALLFDLDNTLIDRDAAVARWLRTMVADREVEPLLAAPLTSRALHRVQFFTGLEALAAGRAQATLMKEVLAVLPPDAAARRRMLTTTRLYLPRLLEKK